MMCLTCSFIYSVKANSVHMFFSSQQRPASCPGGGRWAFLLQQMGFCLLLRLHYELVGVERLHIVFAHPNTLKTLVTWTLNHPVVNLASEFNPSNCQEGQLKAHLSLQISVLVSPVRVFGCLPANTLCSTGESSFLVMFVNFRWKKCWVVREIMILSFEVALPLLGEFLLWGSWGLGSVRSQGA